MPPPTEDTGQRAGLTRRALVAATAGLARPALAGDVRARTLRFVPHAPLRWLDPTFWPFLETRNHAMMVYDTLYGIDGQGRVQPQMALGHSVAEDGRTWRIRLRPGLVFHDGTPVLARDCVASILRWAEHVMMGRSLLSVTDELLAPDDSTIVFRLSRRFPMLAAALGDRAMQICAIMPARLADGTPQQTISEVVGSGPFRFLDDEYDGGQEAAYARHTFYVPRPDGVASFTAGPKLVHFDRVEWHAMPGPEQALAALKSGAVDWWESPLPPDHGAIAEDPRLVLKLHDRAGYMGTMRFNHLTFPFNSPALRRAVLRATDQAAFMAAATGADRMQWRSGVGFFCPQSPMASRDGMPEASLTPGAGRDAIRAAGYGGERIVVLAAGDLPAVRAMAEVGSAFLTQLGFNVQTLLPNLRDMLPRLLRTQPAGAGGWNVAFGYWSGHDFWNPGMHRYLRGDGLAGEVGWPTSERLEAMRRAWLVTPDMAGQEAIAADMQLRAFEDVPYVPLGQWVRPTAHAADLSGMLDGFPLFWNLRRG